MVIENTKYGYLCTKQMSGSPTKILIEMATDLSVTGISSFDISPINRTVKSPEEFELEHYEFTGAEVERIEYPDPEPMPEPEPVPEPEPAPAEPTDDTSATQSADNTSAPVAEETKTETAGE